MGTGIESVVRILMLVLLTGAKNTHLKRVIYLIKNTLNEWWLWRKHLCYSAPMERRIFTSKEIGEAVKRRRKELGISQERLAEILDVSYQQVQRYENGSNKLNVETIQLIAAALSVTVAYLFTAADHSLVAEPPTMYQPAEENTLLKYFRRIPVRSDKLVVVSVARLAAKGA